MSTVLRAESMARPSIAIEIQSQQWRRGAARRGARRPESDPAPTAPCVWRDRLERRRAGHDASTIAAAAVRPGGCRCLHVNYHVLPEPHGCGWIVTSGCGAEVAAICDSREDALVVARIRKVLDRVKNLQRAFTPVGLATSGCFALPAGLAAGIEAADRAEAARPRPARPRRSASQRSLPRGPRAR